MTQDCPYCGSEEVDQDVDFALGTCEDCGFVLREDGGEEGIAPPEQIVEVSDLLDEEQSTDWREDVTIKDSSDENLVKLVHLTEELTKELTLECEGQEQAVEIATEVWVEGLTHGRSLNVVAGVAAQVAARRVGKALPSRVVAEAASVDNQALVNTRKGLTNELKIYLTSPHPIEFIPYLTAQMNVDEEIGDQAITQLEDIDTLPAGDPSGIAAAAFYQQLDSANRSVTYRQLADQVNLTKETVWKRANDLEKIRSSSPDHTSGRDVGSTMSG